VDEWKAAFAERQRLLKELRELREKQMDPQKKALHDQYKQQKEELQKKVESGALTREQMKQQLKEWRQHHFAGLKRETHRGENKESFKAIREQIKQTHEEFDAAIESGDSGKIKAVLPKLLEQTTMINKHLAKKLEEKKN
jgi:hypothetical protein